MASPYDINPVTGKSNAQVLGETDALVRQAQQMLAGSQGQQSAQSQPSLYVQPKNSLLGGGSGTVSPISLSTFTQPSLGTENIQGLAQRYGLSYTDPSVYRQQYLDSLQPGQRELDIQNQLNDIRNQALGVKTSAQTGIQNIKDKVMPMEFITGQAKSVEERANLQLQTLAAQEDALVRDLGLEQSAREAKTRGLEAGMEFATQDRDFLMTLVSKVQDEQQRAIDNFLKYDQLQRTQAADILDSLAGVDPNSLTPQTVAQLTQIAVQKGIDVRDILSALKSQYQSSQADLLYKNAQTQNQLSDSGTNGIPSGILSVSEAQQFGVPYGTSKSDVVGMQSLTTQQRTTLQSLDAVNGILKSLSDSYNRLKPDFARNAVERATKGLVLKTSALLQTNPEATSFEKFKEAILATLARASGERGVLTDQDVERARQNLPTLTDTTEVVDMKLSRLSSLFSELRQRSISTFTSPVSSLSGDQSDPLGILGK